MATEPTSLRLDSEAKREAYAVFEQVGLKPAQAINLFLQQVALTRGIPFPIRIPSHDTREAMAELESGGGEAFETKEEFYKDLGL